MAEPTAGTWIPLSAAVADAGCEIGFVQNRNSARLREEIAERSKTDVIDARDPRNARIGAQLWLSCPLPAPCAEDIRKHAREVAATPRMPRQQPGSPLPGEWRPNE